MSALPRSKSGRATLQSLLLVTLLAAMALRGQGAPSGGTASEGSRLWLKSSAVAFELDAGRQLRMVSWENRLTGNALKFEGDELSLDAGEAPEQAAAVQFRVARIVERRPDGSGLKVELVSQDPPLAAIVRYELDAKQPVLRKFVQVQNTGQQPVRVLNIRLGSYSSPAKSQHGERGTPLYLEGERWIGLAHPAGFALAENGRSVLRQHPGARLNPGQKLDCMEAVYGVALAGEARNSFVSYIRGRSRRVARGHDKPYAMFESFGGKPDGNYNVDEAYLLDNLARLGKAQQVAPAGFDFYNIEFWVDTKGDLTGFDPQRFPNGFGKVRQEIERLGLKLGLWIDSGGLPDWTIGHNPSIKPCMTHADGSGELCRASEPINSMYLKGFIHHVRSNGVRLLKFDNLGPGCQFPVCNNPRHEHLPGPVYSLEAMHNGVIRFLSALDRECPDVFLMLYWGYRSPWWLLHADTYFDAGLNIEAASPTDWPVPYARSGVIQKLDQAQWRTSDTPWLGKDSLGVWLSTWPWNSCIGKLRWQEGVVMDLCRGSMLLQIWTDTDWLTPPEQEQLADFVNLLKANPACFSRSRFILGDPARSEPYGYCCTDGKKAFVAIHNACWKDSLVELKLGPAWGLPEGQKWSLCRWWPRPARLNGSFERQASLALRPYEVVLLEMVPAGTPFSLKRPVETEALTASFKEPTRMVEMAVQPIAAAPAPAVSWTVLEPSSVASARKTPLRNLEDHSLLAGGTAVSDEVYTIEARTKLKQITAILLEALTDESLPARGPGRATNGNFQLSDLRIEVAPAATPEQRTHVPVRSAKADYSQTGHGGWPVEAAIDNNPKSAWSIDPLEGEPHAAVFELAKPIERADGVVLTLRLAQGERQHCIGRLRLSVTDATPPVSLPPEYPRRDGSAIIKGTIPATGGGTLVLWGGKNLDLVDARLAGKPAPAASVWSDQANWRANWQAWRFELSASKEPRELALTVRPRENGIANGRWTAYFVPQNPE